MYGSVHTYKTEGSTYHAIRRSGARCFMYPFTENSSYTSPLVKVEQRITSLVTTHRR